MTFLCNQANEKNPQIFMKKKNTNFDSIFFFFLMTASFELHVSDHLCLH